MEDRLPIPIEEFISLIEAQPVLWDKSLEDYKNRIATQNAWKEIFLVLYPDFEICDDKKRQEYAKKTVKKWTYIRDAFIKSEKKIQYQKLSGSGAKTARPYVYHKQLLFLRKIIEPNISAASSKIVRVTNKRDSTDADSSDFETISNKKEEDTTDSSDDEVISNIKQEYTADADSPDVEAIFIIKQEDTADAGTSCWNSNKSSILNNEPKVQPSTSKTSNRKRSSSNVSPVEAKMKFVDSSYSPRVEPTNNMINRHVSFFNGLIPTLDKFSDDQIIDFQLGVIQLMKNIKNQK